jgi:hypothetical protein
MVARLLDGRWRGYRNDGDRAKVRHVGASSELPPGRLAPPANRPIYAGNRRFFFESAGFCRLAVAGVPSVLSLFEAGRELAERKRIE